MMALKPWCQDSTACLFRLHVTAARLMSRKLARHTPELAEPPLVDVSKSDHEVAHEQVDCSPGNGTHEGQILVGHHNRCEGQHLRPT